MNTDRKQVYLLEDDQDIREIIEFLLESEQYLVTSFSTVKDFLNYKSADRPDAFLLDVMLPDGNGMEVCKILKQDSVSSLIPVVMMSANYTTEDVRESCKADDFIKKPFDILDLVSRIDTQVYPGGRPCA